MYRVNDKGDVVQHAQINFVKSESLKADGMTKNVVIRFVQFGDYCYLPHPLLDHSSLGPNG